ncbi:hemolysin family protein [Actinoalloteichus hymeniacidonis]|uniref:CBS domain-containing protein n=1 Tax=Actinoalloteichus hymeniacidonis TaxID=340345 RepID=A0AAC9HP09_9PSEU|nr:hemolysin family protein [Actinoalloteichus hymeniacidonis]AOS61880.1 CBS domain-containing protein [Actinoalloteichus hymeniacidonis]MBB5910100.1 CBS domain containing-hemolysin-like protein [Actinoalloteichus hymeniacidonis]
MIAAALTLLLGVVVILVIIAANGYFVAQEFAYMSVDRARLRARAAEGDAAARRALQVTGRTSFMLSGAQLGITVTGLLVGYVAEPLVGESLAVLLGDTGLSAAVAISIGTVGALVVASLVQMIFGELYPKNLAIAAPERLARGLSRSTLIYLAVFGWLITFFDHAANLLLRIVRVEPVHDVDITMNAEDLKRAVADSRASGDLPPELSMLIDRVLDFPDQDVAHAMVPRSQVGVVNADTTIGELRSLMAGAHTRYPVLDESEQPVGTVQLVDLLRSDASDGASVTTIMRPPVVVSTLMPLPNALDQLTRERGELACAIDEYGGFAGILTVEDLAEELVGELTDEHDATTAPDILVEESGVWRVGGDVHIDEIERAIGHVLPTGDYETFAGLFIAYHGALPTAGESIEVALPEDPGDLVDTEPVRRALRIEVIELSGHVPGELRARLVEERGTEIDDEEGNGR